MCLKVLVLALCCRCLYANDGVFDLNLDNVNHVYHRAAVMALIKSRGSVLSKTAKLSAPDLVVYEECIKTSRTPVSASKCVSSLMDAIEAEKLYPQSQRESLSPIEKIGELLFGKHAIFNGVLPSQKFQPPLQRIMPVNRRPTYKTWRPPEAENEAPTALGVKEHYYSTMPKSNVAYNRFRTFRRHPIQIQKHMRTDWIRSRRFKRSIAETPEGEYPGLAYLAKIEEYYRMLRHTESIAKRLNDANGQYINSVLKVPHKFRMRKHDSLSVIENVFESLSSVLSGAKVNSTRFSVMSPRVFSLLPNHDDKKRRHFLSPTLFSFHDKDGMFALPDLFKSLNVDKRVEQDWLETLLLMSGASKTLEKVVKQLEPEMKEMREKVYPATVRLEEMERRWKTVVDSYSSEQREDIREFGYAFLEPEQISLLYDNEHPPLDLQEYARMSKMERLKRVDDDIRQLAKLSEQRHLARYNAYKQRRRKRQGEVPLPGGAEVHTDNGEITTAGAGTHHDYSQEEGEGPIGFVTLKPWAFGSRIGHGAALEAVTLSPYAFFAEIMMPEALILQTLGPRAFVPAILSPTALMARVLSPAAFRAEVLSPRALTAFILTPEALLAEVLSPKMLEARVLSPEALIVQVLSPSLIVPRVLSPEVGAVLVLSPSVLSPRVLSGHTLTVEVLSPHVLGGGHSSHEDEEQGKEHVHMPDESIDHSTHQETHNRSPPLNQRFHP